MKRKTRVLLAVDGVVNLVLGAVLLFAREDLMSFLGLPMTRHFFYASILGAVIFGIGIALFLELFGAEARVRGLGLGGAIAINLCGGGALLYWLVAKPLDLPFRGRVILWVVAALVLGIGLAEIAARSWKYESDGVP